MKIGKQLRRFLACGAIVPVLALGAGASGSLLENGSFEDSTGFGDSGWSGHTSLIAQVHDSSGIHGTPPDGDQYLFVGRTSTYSGWTSNISRPTNTLTFGEEYTVSGSYRNWDSIPSLNVTFRVGSQDVVTLPIESTSGAWVHVSGTYVANEADGATPTFQVRITGTQSRQLNLGVDNLSVVPVPEPATMGLLGLGGLGALMRRRTRS